MSKTVKIMYLDPAGTDHGIDQTFAAMAAQYKLPGTEVHIASLPVERYGFSHIEFHTYEALAAVGIIRAVRAAALEGFDAVAIGCFYDTGLRESREISGDTIVTAPCIASCGIVSNIANKFGIIIARRKSEVRMAHNIREYGMEDRLTAFYSADLTVDQLQEDHTRTAARLRAAARKAIEEDRAEALVLGCTMEIGFYEELQREFDVPVIDAAIAALKSAEQAALLKRACGWSPSRKWSCEAPPEAELSKFNIFPDDLPIFGNRIVVEAE